MHGSVRSPRWWDRIVPIARGAVIGQWSVRATIFPRKYRLDDGSFIRTAIIMRCRLPDGSWQYREAETPEVDEWFNRDIYW